MDGRHLKSFWRELGYSPSQRVPDRVRWKRFHLTTKSGPNGHALGMSLRDLVSLPTSLIESIKIVGGESISQKIQLLRSNLDIVPGEKSPGIIRKLVHFPDKENKVRVVAILDYWSQCV